MQWTDVVTAVSSTVSAFAVIVAVLAFLQGRKGLEQQREIAREQAAQNLAFAGAQAAIAWRQQVLELHDRGLTVEQIRHVFLLETGGEGYERENGDIAHVLTDVPPPKATAPGQPSGLAQRLRKLLSGAGPVDAIPSACLSVDRTAPPRGGVDR